MPIIIIPDNLFRSIFLFFILIFLSSAAVFAEQVRRPKLITEELFAPRSEQSLYDKRNRYTQASTPEQAAIWNKLLISMDVPITPPPKENWRTADCHYDNAINTLQQIRSELGESTSYQKIWVENQDKVFSTCDSRKQNDNPPIEPDLQSLPKRANTDFLYQLASWNFYNNEFYKALALYKKVADVNDAPMRPFAVYMTLRTLDKADAYNLIDDILSNKSLSSAHKLVANYKFILGWYGAPDSEKHLSWLLKTIRITPEKAADLEQSFADYFDAMEQIDNYFPLYDEKSKAIDWWLQDIPVDSNRMKAVKALAPKDKMVDWMQAKWAYNVFDIDWLWSLHQADSTYWKQNQNIVTHAWQRWKHNDGLEWLQIAAKRVQPNDDLAVDILKESKIYLEKDWRNETQEYQTWLLDIWAQNIRINLGRKEYKEALNLIEQHFNYKELAQYSYILKNEEYEGILNKSMRWLVYTGQVDEARNMLAIIVKIYPNDFQHWRTLLAKDWSDILNANEIRSEHSWKTENSPELWKKIINILSTQELYNIANNPETIVQERPLIAISALTRAFLLGFDDSKIDEYAKLAANLNPPIREDILSSIAGHDKYKFIEFLVRTPRFRPNPYLQYANNTDEQKRLNNNPKEIDQYNHNYNNWWCQVNSQYIEDDIFNAARITPIYDDRNMWMFPPESTVKNEFTPYLEKQKELLSKHPYKKLMDKTELEELKKLKSAPEYLSNEIIKHANISRWKFWLSAEERNKIASDLHNAIRTTRYGCERNGSHAKYSHKAYKILHKQYPSNTWTKATPYWFGCMDYEYNCGEQKQLMEH